MGVAWIRQLIFRRSFEKGSSAEKKQLRILVTGGKMSKASAVARAVGRDGHKVFTAEIMPYQFCHTRFCNNRSACTKSLLCLHTGWQWPLWRVVCFACRLCSELPPWLFWRLMRWSCFRSPSHLDFEASESSAVGKGIFSSAHVPHAVLAKLRYMAFKSTYRSSGEGYRESS